MQPDNERGRPERKAASEDERLDGSNVPPSVSDPADVWTAVRTGWARSGDAMPRPGSLAWRALPADDPVRTAAAVVDELGVADELRRHGPMCARLLAEVNG